MEFEKARLDDALAQMQAMIAEQAKNAPITPHKSQDEDEEVDPIEKPEQTQEVAATVKSGEKGLAELAQSDIQAPPLKIVAINDEQVMPVVLQQKMMATTSQPLSQFDKNSLNVNDQDESHRRMNTDMDLGPATGESQADFINSSALQDQKSIAHTEQVIEGLSSIKPTGEPNGPLSP